MKVDLAKVVRQVALSSSRKGVVPDYRTWVKGIEAAVHQEFPDDTARKVEAAILSYINKECARLGIIPMALIHQVLERGEPVLVSIADAEKEKAQDSRDEEPDQPGDWAAAGESVHSADWAALEEANRKMWKEVLDTQSQLTTFIRPAEP